LGGSQKAFFILATSTSMFGLESKPCRLSLTNPPPVLARREGAKPPFGQSRLLPRVKNLAPAARRLEPSMAGCQRQAVSPSRPLRDASQEVPPAAKGRAPLASREDLRRVPFPA